VLRSQARDVTFTELRQSIDRLYIHHPGIRSFAVRDVEYTPRTRDKVLRVCHEGGPESDPAALESAKIAGCAPLIFFFYSYGRQSSVAESIEVARKVYWFAVSNVRGPFDPMQALATLLQGWGVP
jgi:hypothetical protein